MTDRVERAAASCCPGMVRATVKASQAKAAATRARKAAEAEPAAVDPVARVLVDVPLAHLDRPFDYPVPAAMADDGGARRPGQGPLRRAGRRRLRARAGRRRSEHAGRLAPLRRVVSAEPVLAPRSRRWPPRSPTGTPAPAPTCCGWRSRRGTPPSRRSRRRRAEPVAARRRRRREAAWADYEPGAGVPAPPGRRRRSPRAVWPPRPATDWPTLVAHAAAATVRRRAAARWSACPTHATSPGSTRALTAVLGPGPARRADRRPRPGRSATALPRGPPRRPAGRGRHPGGSVRAGPRPRPGRRLGRRRRPARRAARAVPARPRGAAAARRAARARPRWSAGSRAPSRRSTWSAPAGPASSSPTARPCAPGRRSRSPATPTRPRPRARGARGSRARSTTPSATRSSTGPVLVQMPRPGYVTVAGLRALPHARPAARPAQGPLRADRADARRRRCRWCGTVADGLGLRASAATAGCGRRSSATRRTAEELGRAFPGTPVRTLRRRPGARRRSPARPRSSSPRRARSRSPRAATPPSCCSTPGCCSRADLRPSEEALRRWLDAAALVRPAAGGGWSWSATPAHPALQALVRWDPAGFAERELAERQSRPTCRRPARLATHHRRARRGRRRARPCSTLPAGAEVLGPVPTPARPAEGEPALPWSGCRAAAGARAVPARSASCSGVRVGAQAADAVRDPGRPGRPRADRGS